ncbi:MAG: hypothetical protein AAGF25_13540 [Pseudomonadota bacterium]
MSAFHPFREDKIVVMDGASIRTDIEMDLGQANPLRDRPCWFS